MSDYNTAVGENRENEHIKTYHLIPDAGKHIDDGSVFIHFSFAQMVNLFFQLHYNNSQKNQYTIENEVLGI